MKTLRFGIIGAGMMGREFASAAARWCHLLEAKARPEIVAVCNRSPGRFDWFRSHFPEIRQFTTDYRELLANPAVEAVYMALPHHLHQEVCCATIAAGKHLMAEKPFGIDQAANQAHFTWLDFKQGRDSTRLDHERQARKIPECSSNLNIKGPEFVEPVKKQDRL